MPTKEEKREAAREKARERKEKQQKRDDAQYLNSSTRVIKRLVFSVIEFILIFVIISLIMDYMNNGSIDIEKLPDTIATYLRPGGVILTALIAFLPVIILANIGVYFGLGSVPRMAFGIAKILAIIVWLHLIANSAGNIDIVELSGMDTASMGGVSLEGFTVNIEPLLKLLDLLLLLCCIVPVGEFIGARAKHNDAVIRNYDRKQEKKEEKEAEKAEKEASD